MIPKCHSTGQSRRSTLALLGLASVGSASAALSTDALAGHDQDIVGPQLATWIDHDRVAQALRALADEIQARGIDVEQFDISSSLCRDNWLMQELTIKFFVKEAQASS